MEIKDLVKMGYTQEIATELFQLLQLKGIRGGEALDKRRQIRKSLRNAGILSLPFSMNGKKNV